MVLANVSDNPLEAIFLGNDIAEEIFSFCHHLKVTLMTFEVTFEVTFEGAIV